MQGFECPLKRSLTWTRTVQRQIHHWWNALELLAPKRKLSVQCLSSKPFAFLRRIIGVLQLQLWKVRRFAGTESFVKNPQFLQENACRPRIANDVMHRKLQDMVLVGEAHQICPDQWPDCQVKRPHRLFPGYPARLAFPGIFRLQRQVMKYQWNA